MSAPPIRKIVIVGGGTAGWMAAAALSKVLGAMPGLAITLIESEAIGTVGVGEATIPQIVHFNKLLGINEAEFMRETHATYKLGIEFVDWTRLGHSYVHPFGQYGIDMLGIEFHHFWLKGLALGDATALDAYSIGAMAGKAGRFYWPETGNPNSPLARLAYAFQFDAGRYARFLRRRAEEAGVTRVEGRVTQIEQHPETGFVTRVALENGTQVDGELFIDCSGFRSLLLGQTLGVPFLDWSKWLPCDRAVAISCTKRETGAEDQPLTRSTARKAGWQWRIPLQHRVGNGHVYASAFMSEDEATETLLAHLDGTPLASPNHIRFTGGHRTRVWEKNVVALGLAGGFLEPLESTAIHLVQSGIARLLAYFPSTAFTQVEIDRFNAETAQDYLDIRDFLVLHYKATARNDSEFWNYCRTLDPPDGLKAKLDMFRSSGRIVREHNELFTETSWLSVMACQGIVASDHHPAAALLPDDEVLRRLSHVRGVIASAVSQMPTQDQFLASIGGAIDPAMRLSA
ncbi:tryptophan halogenase family protein [Altererythrobacter lauratis]|uniref:Tryptophan halogenase family protein n=1 Tax=Alteraurantiacibacter lauratis TaxID=2054627 RepID=A0ABV7EIC6_9SPHN